MYIKIPSIRIIDMLKITNLTVNYGMLEAVKNLGIQVPEGKIVSLLGANGSGKSTILKTISGLKAPRKGEIHFQGQRIDGMPVDEVVKLGIGHIPEGRRLFPYMTVLENLNMGAYTQNNKKEIAKIRHELLDSFPMLKKKSSLRAGNLSGGEQELLAVARALMVKPQFIMMDEPCQGLSPIMVKQLRKTIKNINESGVTILLVEHNVSVALGVADLVYILKNGSIIFEGSPTDFSEDEFTKKVYLAG